MQVKKNGAFLLGGVAMVATMSNVQVSHSAEEEIVIATECLEGGKERNGMSFDWSIVDDKTLVLHKVTVSELSDEENPSGLKELKIVIPGYWNGRSVLVNKGAFSGLAAENAFRLHLVFREEAGRRVVMPKDCSRMFGDSASIVSIDFSGADVSHVTSMMGMFANCARLSELDLRAFNLAADNGECISGMLQECAGLNWVKLSKIKKNPQQVLATMLGEEVNIENKDENIMDVASLNNFIHFEVIVGTTNMGEKDANTENTQESAISSSKSENVKDAPNRLHLAASEKFNDLEENDKQEAAKKQDAQTKPLDVQTIKHKKHWYTPIVRVFSWVRRTVLSWFGR